MGVLDSMGGAAVGTAMGMITGNIDDKRQRDQQQALTNQQVEAQKKLTEYNRKQQEEMWRNTNASAQVAEYRKAGLNIGLMYEGGGAGGQSNVGMGSVTGGQASGGQNSGAGKGMEMGMANAMLQNQIELVKAQTQNVKADTETKGLGNTWEKFLQAGDTNEGTGGVPLKERDYRVTTNQKEADIQNKYEAQEVMKASIRKIDQDIMKMGVDMRKGEAEIERIKTDTGLQKQLQEYRDSMNPMEIERYKKELQLLNENPENNEVVRWIRTILGLGNDLTKIAR